MTKHETYHAINLSTEEYQTLQFIFAMILHSEHPVTALQDVDKKPTIMTLSNYYYNVNFIIEEEKS